MRAGLVEVDRVRLHPYSLHEDLGDLRGLARSIRQVGLLQPIVVEEHEGGLRLRIGRRRLAAARLAGLSRVPAVIHATALDEGDWLVQSVQENQVRALLVIDDRRRAIERLRELGYSWARLGEAFGVAPRVVAGWVCDAAPDPAGRNRSPRVLATRRLVRDHQDEFDQLLAEELDAVTVKAVAVPATTVQSRAERRADIIARVAQRRREDTRGDCDYSLVAARLGYTNPMSLAKAMRRWDRPDLAQLFERASRRAA